MLSDDRHIINEETMAGNLSLPVDIVGLAFAIVLLTSALAIIFWFWFLYRITGNNSQQKDLQVLNHQCEEVIQLIEM